MSGGVMKFGPQWIRTLTDGPVSSTANSTSSSTPTSANHSGSVAAVTNLASSFGSSSNNNNNNNNSNGATGKYKLAEYRYGREEMLALFEQEMEPPEDIKKFTDLYVEKARMPMAMTQMSEEEVKLSTRNWNSEAVLRSSGKLAASAAAGQLGSGGPNAAGGAQGSSSNMNDRDSRHLSERGAQQGAVTAAGVLSSSPRGPPGSLSRIPIEQRGLLSSLNSRGPSTIRNLVGRGSNLYLRSQSHDDEGVDDGSGGPPTSTGFDARFGGLQSQSGRQPSSLRARFEISRASSGAPGSKPIDVKSGTNLDGDSSSERRSVFDRLPSKYSVDDKNVRKDVNGRPIQSGDWRSREWAGSGLDSRGSKVPGEDRSWRSSQRGGAAEDWRSNNSSNTSSSWYVRTDDQRNLRAGAPQNQENLSSGFSGKRDGVRRPSADERHDEEDDVQHRHRRDSLPEWSIGDPLPGDKVGSFDASGAFREIAREEGHDSMMKDSKNRDHSVYDMKSTVDTLEDEWRRKQSDTSNNFNITDSRNLNGVNSSTNLSELEKLSLSDRNTIPNREEAENAVTSHESRIISSDGRREQHERFSDVNFQNSIHNQMSVKKVDLQTRTSPPMNENEHKKSIDNSRDSRSPQQRSIEQSLPANLQQMLKKQQQQQQINQNQQQAYMSVLAGSSNAIQPASNDEDGFAHLERAAEIMVAEWTAEEDQEPSASPAYFESKLNLIREQQDAQQANMLQNNTDIRLTNQAQHLQTGADQSSVAFDSNNQKKFILLPFNHEDSQQWFYRDTQGVIQGPFSGTEMFEWYKAGYFVKELLVRRACDELFYPLGEVIKMWDRIPFAPIPINAPPPPPITTQALMQFRAVTKQLEIAASMNPSQGQIPPNAFGLAHPGTVLLHGPIIQQQQQQQQVHQVLAAASLNQQNISSPQDAAGMRQMLERQHDQSMVQQRALPCNVLDQNEMQTQLRQLLTQLKNREGFSNLNAQEQQEVLVRQFVASRALPGSLPDQERALLQRANMMPFIPFLSNDQDRFQYQQRMELERRQKAEAEKQGRLIMEQRMKAEEEKQRIMDELQTRQRKQKEENEKHRQEAEKERLLKLSQLKQQQLAKQQEEFRQQMQNQRLQQQQQQQEKQQAIELNSIQQQQQQQIERAKKAAQAQQVQQEQQRKTAWSTVSKSDQEPVSLASLQKVQEEEKEKEKERQRQIQQQIQSNRQQQHLQQQLQRQMTWANAAQQSKAAPIKTLAEIQKEEEERLAKEKQKKSKVQPIVPNAGVWNNAASHLSWKNPPADS